VGARKLQDILRSLPESAKVSLVLEDKRLQVRAGKSRFSLQTLPAADARSRAILAVMKDDEARHADNALAAGAHLLPQPIPTLTPGMSKECEGMSSFGTNRRQSRKATRPTGTLTESARPARRVRMIVG